MTVAYRSYNYQAPNDAGEDTLSFTEPAGTVEGDILYCFCMVPDPALTMTWTDPTDWTDLAGGSIYSTVGGPNRAYYIGAKIRGATAGQTLDFVSSVSENDLSGTMVCISGADTGASEGLDVAFVEANHFTDNVPNSPLDAAQAITTNTDDAMVLLFQHVTTQIDGAAGEPAGYTEDVDELTSALSQEGFYVAHKIVASAGTETPGDWTHTDTLGTGESNCITLAIKPAGGVTITDVSTDEAWADGDTGIPITGTGFV